MSPEQIAKLPKYVKDCISKLQTENELLKRAIKNANDTQTKSEFYSEYMPVSGTLQKIYYPVPRIMAEAWGIQLCISPCDSRKCIELFFNAVDYKSKIFISPIAGNAISLVAKP